MIICIDLRGQENALFTKAFTFYEIQERKFTTLKGKQAWEDWEEFEDCFVRHYGEENVKNLGVSAKERLSEFQKAAPEWVYKLRQSVKYSETLIFNEGTSLKEVINKANAFCWYFDYGMSPDVLKMRTKNGKIIIDLPLQDDEEEDDDEDSEVEQ